MGTKAELDAIAALERETHSSNERVRIAAVKGLARYINHPEAVAALERVLHTSNERVRIAAIESLSGVQ